jgi:nitroreductase
MTATSRTAVHELVSERRSPRAFSNAPIPAEDLESLLEAARWAASSYNEQPWRFVVADRHRNPESHARVASTLVPVNAAWASQAPVLIVAVAKSIMAANGKPNRHAFYDTGAAVAQLTLHATSLGLGVHQMGGFHADQARTLLAIPDGYDPVAVLAVGYPDDAQAAPRQRRPLSDFAYDGVWGAPLSLGEHFV